MNKNTFTPIAPRLKRCVNWWKKTSSEKEIRGSFNLDLYEKYKLAINDNAIIIHNRI